MTVKSRALIGAGKSVWVHSFLDDKDGLTTSKTKVNGIRKFKVNGSAHLMVPDYVLKWSDDGCNKTIYRVTQSDGVGNNCRGTMRDLIAFGEVDEEAISAIKLLDLDLTPIEAMEDDWSGER